MISMTKKYRCRDGVPVTVLAVGVKPGDSVVIIRHDSSTSETVVCLSADGRFYKGWDAHRFDLIEVGPYDDFKIDEMVMMSSDKTTWFKRYFAGVDEDGKPTAFDYGSTSWSKSQDGSSSWNFCRRPTPEELMK